MLRALFGALTLSAAALAQQTFEVASVKPSAPAAQAANPKMAELMAMAQSRMYDGQPRGWLPLQKARLSLKSRPLAGLVASAYGVRQSEVSGPSWMQDARFDIEATFPEGTPKVAVTEMLRALLEERFGLAVHREDKEVSGLALVEAKGGAKLTAAAEKKDADDAPMDAEARRAMMEKMQESQKKRMEETKKLAADSGGRFSSDGWTAKAVTLSQVADWLAARVGKPVMDATGFDGKYDLDLQVVRIGDDTEEYAMAQALAKFGLKLESRKLTISTVVVDRVERTPKEN
jgi:uncharacterized protein (TIGR03435 family)